MILSIFIIDDQVQEDKNVEDQKADENKKVEEDKKEDSPIKKSGLNNFIKGILKIGIQKMEENPFDSPKRRTELTFKNMARSTLKKSDKDSKGIDKELIKKRTVLLQSLKTEIGKFKDVNPEDITLHIERDVDLKTYQAIATETQNRHTAMDPTESTKFLMDNKMVHFKMNPTKIKDDKSSLDNLIKNSFIKNYNEYTYKRENEKFIEAHDVLIKKFLSTRYINSCKPL